VLRKAIKKYGKPEGILSNHGTTFYVIESDKREKGLTEFEKIFDIFEKVTFFNSADEFIHLYSFIRPR